MAGGEHARRDEDDREPSTVHIEDARALVRLLGDVIELRYDPLMQRRRLIDGLCRLTGCGHGYVFVLEAPPLDEPPVWLARISSSCNPELDPPLREFQASQPIGSDPLLRSAALGRDERASHAYSPWTSDDHFVPFRSLAEELGLGDGMIELFRIGPHRRIVGGLVLYRTGGDRLPLSRRERLMARLGVDEFTHMWQTGRILSLRGPLTTLSQRQREVFQLLLGGHAPKQIAQRLGLSLHTVREYIQSLYRKLQVDGRDELLSHYLTSTRPGEDVAPTTPSDSGDR